MVSRIAGVKWLAYSHPTGTGYPEGTLSHLYAFREITQVATFLIERGKHPVLPEALEEKASFNI